MSQNQRRQQLKAQGGSKPYTQRPTGGMSDDGVMGYGPSRSDPEGRVLKVGGFDKLKVANKSNADVVIYLDHNPARSHYVEAGTQEIFDDVLPFRGYKVIGQGTGSGTIGEDQLKITAKLSALDADDQAAYQAQQQDQGLDMGSVLALGNLLG